jgi:hypothetical protein
MGRSGGRISPRIGAACAEHTRCPTKGLYPLPGRAGNRDRGGSCGLAPFDLAELRAFVADVWPLVEPGDAPERWAEAFLVALQGA